MEFFTLRLKEDAARQAGEYVSDLLKHEGGRPLLLLLAGGSSFAVLEHVADIALGRHITIAMSDERYSDDPKINNFGQLTATDFYRRAAEKTCSFIDTRVQKDESPEGLAARFEKNLREWRAEHPDGKIILTQGIGPDGHTCGMMPYPEDPKHFAKLFNDPARWVAGYDANGKNEFPLRVTVTMPFLRDEVAASAVYVVGDSKRNALGYLAAESGNLAETPARILREMRNVQVYTDISL